MAIATMNNFSIKFTSNGNRGLNILPEGGFGNNSSLVFEKELWLACKNTKTISALWQKEDYISSGSPGHLETLRNTRDRSFEDGATGINNDSNVTRKNNTKDKGVSRKDKEHEEDSRETRNKSYAEERLTNLLLQIGFSPAEIQQLINTLKEGDFSGIGGFIEDMNRLISRYQGSVSSGEEETGLTGKLHTELQDFIASLKLTGNNLDSDSKLKTAINNLLAKVSKLNFLNKTNSKTPFSGEELLGMMGTNHLWQGEQPVADITSSLAYWISQGINKNEISQIEQMMKSIMVQNNTGEGMPGNLGDIASRFNFTPLMNGGLGFGAMAPEEVPLLMNSSFIDQLAARMANMITMGRDQLSFAIQPPELGSLKILIRVTQGDVHSLIQAGSEEVKQLLDSKTHHLRQMLQQQGLNLTEFKVNLLPNSSGTGEAWNFAWKENKEQREQQGYRNNQNSRKNRTSKRSFNKQFHIVT